MNMFPRCPHCGQITWNLGDQAICSNPKCEHFDKEVDAVYYDVRRRKNNENKPDLTKNS